MLGNPKYQLNDLVSFVLEDENGEEHLLFGQVYIVDAYGTFFDNTHIYYDIMVEKHPYSSEPALFKHIQEDSLERVLS